MKRGLFFIICFHLIVWTVVPLLSGYAPALDAIEMHSWSLVWQWGYYKHPPLPAWIVGLSEALFGKTKLALIVPSVVSIVLYYLAIGRLAHQILTPKLAVVAIFLSSTSLFYQLWAVGFNHNVVQIPLWAWTITLLYQALLRGYKTDWLMLGLVYGLTLLAKYTAVLLIPPAIIFICLTPSVKQNMRWTHVLLMLLAMVLIVTPHGLWLLHHHFDSFHYAATRLNETQHWGRSFLGFIGTAVFAHIAILFAWTYIAGQHFRVPRTLQPNHVQHNSHFLWLLGFGPFMLACLIGLSGKALAPMWATAMLPLCGVALVYWLDKRALEFCRSYWFSMWFVFQILVVAAFLVKGTTMYYQISKRSVRADYPVKALTQAIQTRWQRSFPGQPLRYIAGPIWEAGIVSFYMPDTPYVIPDGDFSTTPWVDPRRVQTCGIVLLAPRADELSRFDRAQMQPKLILQARTPGLPNIELNWAWVPPQGSGC